MFRTMSFPMVLFLLLLPFLAVAGGEKPATTGEKYRSETCKVELYFPAEFTETIEESAYGDVYTVTCNAGDMTYSLTTVIMSKPIPAGASDYEQLSVNAFAHRMEGEILTQDEWIINGKKGRRAKLSIIAGVTPYVKSYYVGYAVILNEQYMYQLDVFSPEEEYDEEAVNKFLSSFKIL